jgi:hemolysin activation/secretion protein
MKRYELLPLIVWSCVPAVMAQQLPSAGGQMQQIPVLPAPSLPRQAPTVVKPLLAPKQEAINEVSITVNAIQILGASAFGEKELIAKTGFQSGSLMNLSQLRAMTKQIADFYHQQGYFVTQVYLPPQKIQDGVVTMMVLEGRYGQIILQNESRASTETLAYFLKDFPVGSPILSGPLETQLLLMSDTPGVLVNSSLVPGKNLGTSDLLVYTKAASRVNGSIDADNAGNRYTGHTRVGATLNVNELLGLGDMVSLRGMSSGSGLQYVRSAYQAQFGKTTAGLAYTDLQYELGREFQDLDESGKQQISIIYISQPLIRSRSKNLSLGLNLDMKRFEVLVGKNNSQTHKHADVFSATLRGDDSDKLGYTTYGLTWSSGRIDLKDADSRANDLITVKTQGNFNKLSFNANRLQRISESVSMYASVNGQLAANNLDISEKMELGGMYGVRAYPEGEAFGDQGYIVSLETRLQLRKEAGDLPGQVQLIGFVDTGVVHANHTPWSSEENRRRLSAAGVGLIWSQASDFMVRAYYAIKLGNETARSAPDASGRFWVQGVKYF